MMGGKLQLRKKLKLVKKERVKRKKKRGTKLVNHGQRLKHLI